MHQVLIIKYMMTSFQESVMETLKKSGCELLQENIDVDAETPTVCKKEGGYLQLREKLQNSKIT